MADAAKLPADLQRRVDQATADEAAAKARKAVADASDAETTAALNKVKASVGEPPAGPFSGSVELKDGAALAELNRLARTELADAARQVVDEVRKVLGSRTAVLLSSADGLPDLSHDTTLAERCATVAQATRDALELSAQATGASVESTIDFLAVPEVAGLALSAAAGLLGYFKTDFTLAGSALTVSDRNLVLLVAGLLNEAGLKVLLDTVRQEPSEAVRTAAREEMVKLSKDVAKARARMPLHTAALAAAGQVSAQQCGDVDVGEGGSTFDPVTASAAHELALAACTSASDLFDALTTSLYADATGEPFLVRALAERTLRGALGKEAAFVSLRVDGAWGSQMTRKSLLSGLLGRIPLFVSATVGVSWAAFDQSDGCFLGGDLATRGSALSRLDAIGKQREVGPVWPAARSRPRIQEAHVAKDE